MLLVLSVQLVLLVLRILLVLRGALLDAIHEYPGQIWFDIFHTCMFQRSTEWRDDQDRVWLKFCVRNPGYPRPKTYKRTTLYWEDPLTRQKMGPLETNPGDAIAVYHQTLLRNLVRPSEWMTEARGILNDGFRYGSGSHRGCRGVNFYSKVPTFNFKSTDADIWCICHVLALEGKLLKGGADYRYCVRGIPGMRCNRVCLQAFSVQKKHVPEVLIL